MGLLDVVGLLAVLLGAAVVGGAVVGAVVGAAVVGAAAVLGAAAVADPPDADADVPPATTWPVEFTVRLPRWKSTRVPPDTGRGSLVG